MPASLAMAPPDTPEVASLARPPPGPFILSLRDAEEGPELAHQAKHQPSHVASPCRGEVPARPGQPEDLADAVPALGGLPGPAAPDRTGVAGALADDAGHALEAGAGPLAA